MIILRQSSDRGHADHGWLKSYHTFSFADYYDPKHNSFRTLRVINEDWIAPGKGFGMHPHRDMEIITVVVQGELAHKDSMGNAATIRPGEVQRMSAGTGVLHSEFNNSSKETVHLLQIWIIPAHKGITPSYEQKPIHQGDNPLQLIACDHRQEHAVTIQQNVDLYFGFTEKAQNIEHRIKPGRAVWLQMIEGAISVNGVSLSAGDGAAIEEETLLTLQLKPKAKFLLFDLE